MNNEQKEPVNYKEIVEQLLKDAKHQELNQTKIEYDRMTSFHEKLGTKLIWAIGILFTVFGVLFYSSFKDMKEDMKNEVKEIKDKAKDAKQEYDTDLEDIKSDAKEILARNKEISDFQIQFLKEDVKSMALSSSRNRIDEILNSPNVQALVEQRTRKEVAEKLNEVVQEETAKTREVFDNLPQITIAYDQIRQGSRKHLDILDSMSNYSNNKEIRVLAKKLLLQKGKDYLEAIYGASYQVNRGIINNKHLDTTFFREKLIHFNSNEAKIREIMKNVKSEVDLYNLANYYVYLNLLVNQKFDIFDSKPVYDWYTKNYK